MSQHTLYNLELEKLLLAGLLNYPASYAEFSIFLRADSFYSHNSIIYEVVTRSIENKELPTAVIIADKINNLGIKLDIDVGSYLIGLKNLGASVSKNEIPNIAKEIKKLSLVRNIVNRAELLKNEVVRRKNDKASEIIKCVDEAFGKSLITLDSDGGDAINLYERLPDLIEERGNNPVENRGFITPYPLFNQYYSGLRKGGLYVILSPSGSGKSTFLLHCLDQTVNICNPDKDICGLLLDTEMSEEDSMIRLAASRSGVPAYLLDSGMWRKDERFYPIVVEELKKIRNMKNKNLFFKNVSNMGLDDLQTYIRSFIYKNIGRFREMIGVYDYVKPLNSDYKGVYAHAAEWQIGYAKSQVLKDLALEFNMPWLTAMQTAAEGETMGKSANQIVDNVTVAAVTKRISWLTDMTMIFRRRVPEEIANDGIEFGTHKLIVTKSRHQGRMSTGHQDLVKVIEGKNIRYKSNFLNFDVSNFNVKECGCLRDIVEKQGKSKIRINSDKSDVVLF